MDEKSWRTKGNLLGRGKDYQKERVDQRNLVSLWSVTLLLPLKRCFDTLRSAWALTESFRKCFAQCVILYMAALIQQQVQKISSPGTKMIHFREAWPEIPNPLTAAAWYLPKALVLIYNFLCIFCVPIQGKSWGLRGKVRVKAGCEWWKRKACRL